jgi:TolB-like protein/tetratricopeptide (TPR) repeat protein
VGAFSGDATVNNTSDVSLANTARFELDLGSAELREGGVRVKLQPQPCRILALLASRPGQLVTREEIRREIWGDDTYVDFEKGINSCIRLIRAALRDDAQNPRYIETLSRRGYRFMMSSREFVCVPLAKTVLERTVSTRCSSSIIVAVLPFDNLGGTPEQELLAEGLTEVLTTSLAQSNGLRVISRASASQYKKTCQPVSDIAKALHADFVIKGTVLRSSRLARVTAELIDPANEQDLWAEGYERESPDSFSLMKEVGEAIAHEVMTRVGLHAWSDFHNPHLATSKARMAYVKGRFFWSRWTETGLRKAIECFEEAVREDPGYALAYAGLAECYLILPQTGPIRPQEAYVKASAAAMKAVDLDDGLAEAHSSLAYSKMISEWNWRVAESEFRRAIELNPSCAIAHQCYSDYLTATGRHREAIAQMERASELDPMSPMINTDVAWSLIFAGQYDRAIEQYRKVLEIEPNFLQARWGLGLCYLQKCHYDEAILELRRATSLSPETPMMLATLGYAYARWGKKDEARKLLQDLRQLSRRRYVPSYDVAALYLGLGDKDQAFSWLQRACAERCVSLIYLVADPRFEMGRSDPRLRAIASRVGLRLPAFAFKANRESANTAPAN